MSEKSLVIVESPTKAKTLKKFLGPNYIVTASNGHIRDLPNNASEIPASVKKESWARLGINVEDNFSPLYVVPSKKKDHVKKIKDFVKDSNLIFLATDEDREGESISWHLLEVLKPKIPTKRLVFHEITKEAIFKALENPRSIDENLVKAQETRRIIDRLYGYEVSPLLWKKMAPGLSAGRVQSVAIRLLVEKEKARIAFKSADYWGVKALLKKEADEFDAELIETNQKKVATGKDFDPDTGKLKNSDKIIALSESQAKAISDDIKSNDIKVKSVEEKPFTNKPLAPFVTSTLQQEANYKLRMSARHTMSVAQVLYENGFITYMRTDSTTLSDQAIRAAQQLILDNYGKDFLHEQPRVYTTKVKNAQEAHEAIRPAGERFSHPEEVKKQLGIEAFKLYDLIWKRTIASQMKDAKGTYVVVQLSCKDHILRSSGKTITFPGFMRAYVEGADDPNAELADKEKFLPKLTENEKVALSNVEASEHKTLPPARYTEGSLIKELERLGIGRPSTWATVVDLVLSRSYAFKKGNALVPTFVAMAVINLLEQHFPLLLDYEFTARLEDDLDAISRGEEENIKYLSNFYNGNGHPGLKQLVKKGEEVIDPRIVCGISIGRTKEDKELEIRIGKWGPFISDGENRASVPDGTTPDEMTLEKAEEILHQANKAPEAIGFHPESNEPIYLKSGPYGTYLELGDLPEDGDKKKRKMASLLPGTSPEEVTVEYAVKLFSLPRNLGKNTENGEDVIASNGRYGPYISCGKDTRTIPLDQLSPLDITLEQALELLKQPKRRGRGVAKPPLKDIGKHPVTEKHLVIKSGRFGPYVTDGELNASVPRGRNPEDITIEDAIGLLEARARKIAEEELNGEPKAKKAKAKSTKKAPKKTTSTKKAKKKS